MRYDINLVALQQAAAKFAGPARQARDSEDPEAAAPRTPPVAAITVAAPEGPFLSAEMFLSPASGPTSSVAEQGPPPGSRTPPGQPVSRAALEGPPPPSRRRRRGVAGWLGSKKDAPGPDQAEPRAPGRSVGMAAAFAAHILNPSPHDARPRPLGQDPYDPQALLRDTFRPWG